MPVTRNDASSGLSTKPEQQAGGVGSKTWYVFTALHMQMPATGVASVVRRNSLALIKFGKTAEESCFFDGKVPEGQNPSPNFLVTLAWYAATAQAGNVRLAVACERANSSIDSDTYEADVALVQTVTTNKGMLNYLVFTIPNSQEMVAGSSFRLRVTRKALHPTDTMLGDCQVRSVELQSA